jgi:hypothetical protein
VLLSIAASRGTFHTGSAVADASVTVTIEVVAVDGAATGRPQHP